MTVYHPGERRDVSVHTEALCEVLFFPPQSHMCTFRDVFVDLFIFFHEEACLEASSTWKGRGHRVAAAFNPFKMMV